MCDSLAWWYGVCVVLTRTDDCRMVWSDSSHHCKSIWLQATQSTLPTDTFLVLTFTVMVHGCTSCVSVCTTWLHLQLAGVQLACPGKTSFLWCSITDQTLVVILTPEWHSGTTINGHVVLQSDLTMMRHVNQNRTLTGQQPSSHCPPILQLLSHWSTRDSTTTTCSNKHWTSTSWYSLERDVTTWHHALLRDCLHCCQRLTFTICLLVYKSLHRLAPS